MAIQTKKSVSLLINGIRKCSLATSDSNASLWSHPQPPNNALAGPQVSTRQVQVTAWGQVEDLVTKEKAIYMF